MNLKLEFEFSKAEIITEVDALKKQVDALRPLPTDVEGRVMQKLRLDWNYHSNAIEGNKLNYGETVAFLMEGITAKGKPLKDHLDIRGHNQAINFLLEIVKDTRLITEADIRALHEMILVEPYNSPAQTADGLPTTKRITLGQYKTSPNHVKTSTGEIHYYATPEETPAKMEELMEWYDEVESYPNIHPVVIAALFHHKFVEIHPFDDGNGRLSRILMNLILMQHGYPPVVVKMEDRTNYYSLLSRADVGDSWPFVEYIAELAKSSLQLYLKAASGGDIDDDEDIDKEIALFKMELQSVSNVRERKSSFKIRKILTNELDSLINQIDKKARNFEDFFFSYQLTFKINDENSVNRSFPVIFYKIPDNEKEEFYKNLRKILFIFSFKNFKSSLNDFDVILYLEITFGEYYYKFANGSEHTLVSMPYDKTLSLKEKQIIIRDFISEFKSEVERSINEKAQNDDFEL